jgi:hypothetical protein
VVDQAAHHAIIADPGRGRDGQQQRPVALAGPRRHRLERVVGDHVQLIHDGKRRVPSLQGARIRGQRHEHRVGTRFEQVVGEGLHAGGQLVVELDHPLRRPQDDAGLPLVAGDDEHPGALDAIGQQPEQPQRRGQGALAVPGGDGDESLPRPRLIQDAMHDGALPRPYRMRNRAPVPLGVRT